MLGIMSTCAATKLQSAFLHHFELTNPQFTIDNAVQGQYWPLAPNATMAYYFSDLQRFRREQINTDMTDEEFQQRKIENDRRLKRAFDHIFEKYNRNFDDIGDEIDLEKEEIVVNNGHIELMEHNRDDGKRTNHILRSLACGAGWEGEDETESEDHSEESDSDDNLAGHTDGESSVGQVEDEVRMISSRLFQNLSC